MLAALGWPDPRIAAALGITRPTLRKHYLSELKRRDEARPRVEMALLEALLAKATAGSVPAVREFRRQMHEADLASGRAAFTGQGQGQAGAARPAKLGKKEAAAEAARQAGAGTDWGDDLLGGLH